MPAPLDLATVEAARFAPLLHETFSAVPGEKEPGQVPFELELTRALNQPLGGREDGRTPFSLFFDGPAGLALEQGLYTVEHPQLGEFLLFLVPVARKNARVQLQAVFN